MTILSTISIGFFVVSFLFFLASLYGTGSAKYSKKCTQQGIGTIEKVYDESRSDTGTYFKIRFEANASEFSINVPLEHTEGIRTDIGEGETVPIWFNPNNPKQVIISADPQLKQTKLTWKKIQKRALIIMAISFVLSVISACSPSRENEKIITVYDLCKEDAPFLQQTPTLLTYFKSKGSPNTFSLEINDPSQISKVLNLILKTKIINHAEHVDMYWINYDDYRFDFDENTYTFSFLSDSYFCFNGAYYEIIEGDLDQISLLISLYDTPGLDEPISEWYQEGTTLETNFIDNSDEALE